MTFQLSKQTGTSQVKAEQLYSGDILIWQVVTWQWQATRQQKQGVLIYQAP